MSSYMKHAQAAPDSDFEQGDWHHLCSGNTGRLLDARRTPIKIIAINTKSAEFTVQVMDFEDRGACWELPFEDIQNYQISRAAQQLNLTQVNAYFEMAETFNQNYEISCSPEKYEKSQRELSKAKAKAHNWLSKKSQFLEQTTAVLDLKNLNGHTLLYNDLQTYMQMHHLSELESSFAQQYVSHPGAGEMVKAHRMALAHMGWVPYKGKRLRNPNKLKGDLSLENRQKHILLRTAFVQALFESQGITKIWLYRGLRSTSPPELYRYQGFVSTSFNLQVAQSHLLAASEAQVGIVYRQYVPITRLFMSYFETEAMNHPYQEAEALLFSAEGHWPF